MRKAALLASLLAMALSACGGGPRPIYEPPPMPREPPAREVPRAPSGRPAAHPALVVQAPAGPLLVAKVEPYMDALEMELRRHVHARGIITARQGNLIDIVIQNDRLFTADGGVAGDDVLEPLAAILRGYVHVSVAVSGHTDTAGPADKNLAISQKRASLIAGALVHEGVAASRISAQGFGETRLRVRTGDDKAEPRNRRIEILLKPVPG